MDTKQISLMSKRFRGFLPVVIDVETGGLNSKTDALLEIAAVLLNMDENGLLFPSETISYHVNPFPGANIEEKSLEITGIIPDHPFRFAVEEKQALGAIFKAVRKQMKKFHCHRAVLVGHNPIFDLDFVKAACKRCGIKRDPFHPFTTLDTATLGGLAVGQTVLAKAVESIGLEFDQKQAHSAIYDTERTAELFCFVINRWQQLGGWQIPSNNATKNTA